MASVLQKLITPLFSGPPEPPRNKVTVVGVGQVGMACAISILLKVRVSLVLPLLRLLCCLLVSQDGVTHKIFLDCHEITDVLVSDLTVIPLLYLLRRKHVLYLSTKREDFLLTLFSLVSFSNTSVTSLLFPTNPNGNKQVVLLSGVKQHCVDLPDMCRSWLMSWHWWMWWRTS